MRHEQVAFLSLTIMLVDRFEHILDSGLDLREAFTSHPKAFSDFELNNR